MSTQDSSWFPLLFTFIYFKNREAVDAMYRSSPDSSVHCIHTPPPFPVHSVLVSAWERGCCVPGCSLTVCCIGSTGLRLCHSCPSQCLPCSASHNRTCLTLQPLSEMDERRKHILLLWATHTQWAATKCPSAASQKQGKKGLLIASSYSENIQGLTSSCGCAIHWLIKTSRI